MNWREIAGPGAFTLAGPNRWLLGCAWWNVGLLVLSLAALPFDRRRILGLNPWIKPIKFEISVIVFVLTVALLLSALGRLGAYPRWRELIAFGIGLAMAIENTIIAMQSLRGVRSHMNYTSWFNALSFATMGLFVAINTALLALLLVLYLRADTGLPQALTLGIQLGLVFILAGSLEGVFMIVRYQAHTVGAADGGTGLAFVNWSTGHGDLRVAHFFALHALQILPLAGWAIACTRLPQPAQLAVTLTFAAAYTCMVWLLFAQAVAGRPLWSSG